MTVRESMEKVVTAILLLGLLLSGLGFVSWALSFLDRYSVSWELKLTFLGFIFVLFGLLLARIFSRE